MSPASEDWFPPSKSIVSFLRWTADRSKGSGLSSVMVAVARRDYAKHFVFIPIRYVNLAICARVFRQFLTPGALSRLVGGWLNALYPYASRPLGEPCAKKHIEFVSFSSVMRTPLTVHPRRSPW